MLKELILLGVERRVDAYGFCVVRVVRLTKVLDLGSASYGSTRKLRVESRGKRCQGFLEREDAECKGIHLRSPLRSPGWLCLYFEDFWNGTAYYYHL
jgi:hypothetical protein